MEAVMETQSAAEDGDGFTKISGTTGKRGKKRRAEEQLPEDHDNCGQMDTERPQPLTKPLFPPLSGDALLSGKDEIRKIPVPTNRYTPLKENWMKIFTPVVEHLGLQIRFNLKSRNVEIRTCKETRDASALTKAVDFVKAFILGFQVEDALALIRLDDLFLESFEITDGKFISLALSKILKWQEQLSAISSLEVLHPRSMVTFELWLAEQQIDFNFKIKDLTF
ncbi:RNA-binding protein PNO1 isoform X2 [Antechinus flavipes]|uniref:RNA-binding protein PNO1 isoform X2 n=1 Tax=Antechinus flavipes TaxID=38775 RepID=UPI0022365BE6|nr:RNA-binding protein PNO1 isoform X2 [Antechinus flavipes]